MKKFLLLTFVLLSLFSNAQAVFEIESPSSIKGFYKIGLGDYTVDTKWGNGNTTEKSISASLALGKDSLAREALELNVKGKIAVLYRGVTSFTDIALRAQAAGAVAAIIVNNRPVTDATQGGAWNMTPSTGSENLKIPLIMISQEDGLLITNMIRKGEDVKGYIGKKRMLAFDVKVTKDWIATPLYRSLPVYLAKKGMISDTLGLSVMNAGTNEVRDIFAIADVTFGGKSIYADTIKIESIGSRTDPNRTDTVKYVKFIKPFKPDYDLPTGIYTLKYSLHHLQTIGQNTSIVKLSDEFQDDNEIKWSFTISDSTLAIGNIVSYTAAANNNTVYTNKANWSTATNSGANLKDFKSCVAYKNKNLDKVNINSMDFLGYSLETNGTLQNSKVGVVVYKWKSMPGNIFDPNYRLTIDELTPVVESEYVFKNAFKSDYGTYSFKNDGLTLDPNEMYMFCVSTTSPSIGFGYNRNEPSMWPSIAFNQQFIMPVYSDGTFYTTGFGSDRIPAITLNFSEKSVKSSSKDIISYALVSPAVQASVGVDKVTLTVPNSTDVNNLVAKFKLSPKATMTINGVAQTSETTVNNFTTTLVATITAEDGTTKTYDIILTKAAKSSEKIIVSCKQGVSFGMIESDKITFNLPTNTDTKKLVFTYTVSPFAKAYIFDTLGSDKDSTFTTDATVVNASGLVKIKVVAEDGTFKLYDLIVKLIKSPLKQLTSFSFISPAATGTISNGIVSISVPKGTDLTKLVANFTSSNLSKVYIGNVLQTSGVTVNNFTNSLTYIVVAEDGSQATYKVNVCQVSEFTEKIISCNQYYWNGKMYNQSGKYVFSTKTSKGCDSIVTLDLTINTLLKSTFTKVTCGSYEWNNQIYTQSGQYDYPTKTLQGCDSIATLILTINNPTSSTISKVACGSFEWNGQRYVQSGKYDFYTKSVKGCDSTATLYLTINNPSSSSITIKECGSYTWNGKTYTQSGKYDLALKAANGCDSIVTLNLTILSPTTSTTTHATTGSYFWNGVSYTQSGLYTYKTKNAIGCDSVATLLLTINVQGSSTTIISACDKYEWNGNQYTQTGTYTYKTKNSKGVDSVAMLLLTINNSIKTTITHAACGSYVWNGKTYTQSGNYEFVSKTIKGCDSIVTLFLTVNKPSFSNTTFETCGSFIWNGKTYTQTGKYDYISKSVNGCDSIATLNLTILTPSTSTTLFTANGSYLWNGVNYTQSGIYTFKTKNINGCDSVATLLLTINAPGTSTTIINACESYKWNGSSYNQTGTYSFKTKNGQGNDSIATLLLTINKPTISVVNETACGNYLWNGKTYTQSGKYEFISKNSKGCDSIATLYLTINNPNGSSFAKVICGSYTWNGKTYTQSGKYEFITKNARGCDSIVTLDLTINPMPSLGVDNTNSTLISSQSSASYQWYNCDSMKVVLPNSTDQKYVPNYKGNYAVKINLNGCIDTSECVMFDNQSTTGLANVNQLAFSIYPNPNNGIFSVSGLTTGTYKIFDVLGTEVHSFRIQTNEIVTLDLSHLAKGVYHFATEDAQKLNGKVVITD